MKITEIKLESRPAADVLEIVRELRRQGLVQGNDFDFKYDHTVSMFYFYQEKYATWFALKYC